MVLGDLLGFSLYVVSVDQAAEFADVTAPAALSLGTEIPKFNLFDVSNVTYLQAETMHKQITNNLIFKKAIILDYIASDWVENI